MVAEGVMAQTALQDKRDAIVSLVPWRQLSFPHLPQLYAIVMEGWVCESGDTCFWCMVLKIFTGFRISRREEDSSQELTVKKQDIRELKYWLLKHYSGLLQN